MPVVGGQPRKLIDDVTEVEWSPDGRQLAFLRRAQVVEGEIGTEIGLLDIESGDQRILHKRERKVLFGLSWSPDGTRISVSQATLQSGAGAWRVLLAGPAKRCGRGTHDR